MKASTTSIGQHTLNRRLGCLEDGRGNTQHLRPKSYRVLELLIERRGTLVSKDDLAAGAWNDLTVTDESLSQCISDIRRVLGKEDAKLLRTVPRRGYVLKAQETHAGRPETSAWLIRVGTVVLSMAAAVLVYGAGTFSGVRDYKGWFLAASLAHAGRIEEASAVIRQAQISRPERTLDGVAVSLDSLEGQNILELVLEGLRLAGMPG